MQWELIEYFNRRTFRGQWDGETKSTEHGVTFIPMIVGRRRRDTEEKQLGENLGAKTAPSANFRQKVLSPPELEPDTPKR